MKHPRWRRLLLPLWGAALAAALFFSLNGPPASGQGPDFPAADPDTAALLERLQAQGSLRLIVMLDVPWRLEALQQVGAADAQAAAVAQAQQGVLASLPADGIANPIADPTFPDLSLEVTSPEALAALLADPRVRRVYPALEVPPLLYESVPLIRGHFAHTLFYRGNGQAVVVMDTGVDRFHPALSGKVVAGACFSTPGGGATSLCPGGASSSTTLASGQSCASSISGCDHGTHVAGIVAGVAPEADLISIQVFRRATDSGTNTPCANANRTSPCTLSSAADIDAALAYVYNTLRGQHNIAAINMSLGGGKYTALCDQFESTKLRIDALTAAGIAVVVATGNSGFTDAMGWPACHSSTVKVSATDKSDRVASFANVAPFMDVFAPGVSIYAPVLANQYQFKSGTSMAAPHVAGAFAVMAEALASGSNPPGGAAKVFRIRTLLRDTGIPVNDNRSGGSTTKPRIDLYAALCGEITCDSDDYPTLFIGQTRSAAINPGSDRDFFFYNGQAGDRLTVAVDRTSGSMDPYVELFDPDGTRVAVNNNGGDGLNAFINGYTLQQTGRYLIRVRSANNLAGSYQIRLSQEVVTLNPAPHITVISPNRASANPFASDFWVRIDGRNFLPTSRVYWNGSLRSMFYSSSNRIWIRVRGSDINFPAPRTAFISVQNPGPGGGYSNVFPFSVQFPFLGESELLAPPLESTITTGVTTTFALRWTAPVTATTWRSMQSMDLILRDQQDNVAAWVRVIEQPGPNSFYTLLNGAQTGQPVGEGEPAPDEPQRQQGLPGEDRLLIITDTVTLVLAESEFFGSGLTAIMTPTLVFGPNAVGTYNVEFRVDRKVEDPDQLAEDEDLVQEDILGRITIVPADCPAPVRDVTLSGPQDGLVGVDYLFSATVDPGAPTQPITYTWAPEPLSGQGTPQATYRWEDAGQQVVSVGVENCVGVETGAPNFAAAVHPVGTYATVEPNLSITKRGPATTLAGVPLTYTLTVRNAGAMTATNVLVTDTLPAGAAYVSGGTLAGDQVRWELAELSPYGTSVSLVYTVTASSHLTNTAYGASADGGISTTGAQTVTTYLVDAQTQASPTVTATLVYTGPSAQAGAASMQASTVLTVPPGAVFAETTLAYSEKDEPGYPLPEDRHNAGRAFELAFYQDDEARTDLTLAEAISVSLGYDASMVPDLAETGLQLHRWDGSQWSQEGITCTVNPAQAQVDCHVEAAQMGRYALFYPRLAALTVAGGGQSQRGAAGATVRYTLTVTNTGTGADSFAVSVNGAWPASSTPSTVGPLNAGEGASFTVDVTIPADAAPGASDVTGVTVSSAWDSAVLAEAQLTTTVEAPAQEEWRVYLPNVQR